MPRSAKETLVRFVTGEVDKDSEELRGVFQAAFRLRDDGKLFAYEEVRLREISAWFDSNLQKPTRLTSAKPPHYRKRNNAISWFRSSASEHIGKIRELLAILDAHHVRHQMLKTKQPGYVVYEDEYQVVSVPFKQ
jgi:hypothetical protein